MLSFILIPQNLPSLTWLTIEWASLNREYAFGVFLDIEGAFDNLNLDVIIHCLEARKVCPTLLPWYHHYLTHCSIQETLKGISTCQTLTKGTLQGGVLSPLMSNIDFDGFFKSF
jgi:retron-type reverse transcriptase